MSINLAMSFALSPVCSSDPSTPISRPGSVAAARAKLYAQGLSTPRSEVSIYKGISDRPLGWKRRKTAKRLTLARESELCVQRWDGRSRMACPWDGLSRDQELWYPDGDCLIHLYAARISQRGPAFRIPFDFLFRSECGQLLTRHLSGCSSTASSPISGSSEDASYFILPVISQNGQYELYIPATPLARNQSMRQHIRTRNFLAWVCKKPLVGENLGQALVDLLEIMREWRSEGTDSLKDLMEYMDDMGYSDMCDAPEHAIVMLIFSEHIKDDLLWAEAFRHVVGMWDACVDCASYTAVPLSTRSLITRAHYSLTLRLHSVSTSLATFLDEQLSPAHIALSDSNLKHLEHFRDFLCRYWMSVMYYPPIHQVTGDYTFGKPLLYQMRKQFQALYDYLVNRNFQPQDPSPDAARGGLCVLQSVQTFDSCGRFEPMAYPLPLLPEAPKVIKQTRSFGTLLGKKDKLYVDPRLAALSTLSKASNAGKPELLQTSLVKAFRLFEKQSIFADAKETEKRGKKKGPNEEVEKRKVRWLLVYGIIQTLRTVTEVDEMVSDVDRSVDYFLCSKAPSVPWLAGREATPEERVQQHNTSVAALAHTPSNSSSSTAYTTSSSTRPTTAESSPTEPKMNIEPDIDHVALSRRNSHATNDWMAQAPSTTSHTIQMRPEHRRPSISLSLPSRPHLKLRTQSLPTSEPIRISPTSPVRPKGTITRALSSLGNMPKLQQPKPMRPNSAILVAGYGNGTGEVCVGWEGQEELHRLKRSSVSSGESTYDDAAEDNEDKTGVVKTSVCPAHGYEDCLSNQSCEEDEDVFDGKTGSNSPSTATSLSRSGSNSDAESKARPLPSAPVAYKSPRPRVVQRLPSETVYKELGNRMSKVRVSFKSVEVSSVDDSGVDELEDLEEIEFGKKGRQRDMLTLLEALALNAMV